MKRYRLAIDSDDTAYGYEDDTGEWVKWEDVEKLRADIKVLSEAVIASHTANYTCDRFCTCQACEVARRYN